MKTESRMNFDKLISDEASYWEARADMRAQCRYTVNISFKQGLSLLGKRTENISEPVKTLKQAREYKSILDNTVKKACIFDMVTNKVVEWWIS